MRREAGKLVRMPELPEVETTRRGLAPHLAGRRIARCHVRDARLRWPIDPGLHDQLVGRQITTLKRRGKYLLIELDAGCLLVHLGMSGSLRFLEAEAAPSTHDHVDIVLAEGGLLRYNDPRRFGSMHFTTAPQQHALIRHLGPEPLSEAFDGSWLKTQSRGRRSAVKTFIMNGQVVVGVGNIYANEALYRSGIRPTRAAGRISASRYETLAGEIKAVLEDAIRAGGTTLRDFVNGDGKPGYFRQSLDVYERGGEACRQCSGPISRVVLGQRATYFCPRCQT